MTLKIGDKAPNFSLPGSDGATISLIDTLGKNIVLYFYPKDDTPGCTTEGKDFSALIDEFSATNTVVLGASKDSPTKHDKFIDKHALKISLISDEDGQLMEAYGVWVEKNMYGRKYMGIERATYLIDQAGVIQQIWRKVRVKGHAEKVLEAAREL